MSKEERFEVMMNEETGKWCIKDNEQLPSLLDNYKACVRLNEFAEKVKDLQSQLAEKVKVQNQKAIEELEKVNGVLIDTILEVAANEIDANKLCYLEEKFYEKIDQQINELKGEKTNEIKSY